MLTMNSSTETLQEARHQQGQHQQHCYCCTCNPKKRVNQRRFLFFSFILLLIQFIYTYNYAQRHINQSLITITTLDNYYYYNNNNNNLHRNGLLQEQSNISRTTTTLRTSIRFPIPTKIINITIPVNDDRVNQREFESNNSKSKKIINFDNNTKGTIESTANTAAIISSNIPFMNDTTTSSSSSSSSTTTTAAAAAAAAATVDIFNGERKYNNTDLNHTSSSIGNHLQNDRSTINTTSKNDHGMSNFTRISNNSTSNSDQTNVSNNTNDSSNTTIISLRSNNTITTNGSINSISPGNRSSHLPLWFYDYAKWHTETIKHINVKNYKEFRFVILQCVKKDEKCFGASDRLKMIPVILKLAYQSKRIFYIYWSKPYPIEEFLLPNTQYLNWTIPYSLYNVLNVERNKPYWTLGQHSEHGMLDKSSLMLRIIRIKSMVYASHYYDMHLMHTRIDNAIPVDTIFDNHTATTITGTNLTSTTPIINTELPMMDAYSEFWKALFIPSPGVYNVIRNTLHELDVLIDMNNTNRHGIEQNSLIPNIYVKPYISVHIRALYTKDKSEQNSQINAIRCANELREQYIQNSYNFSADLNRSGNDSISNRINYSDIPIYIASDSNKVIHRAIQYGIDQTKTKKQQLNVISRATITNASNKSMNGTIPIVNPNPYHIDQVDTTPNNVSNIQPSDFYDTFVDLYILALGQCYTWGHGGYGSWSSAIGNAYYNRDKCSPIVHSKHKCK